MGRADSACVALAGGVQEGWPCVCCKLLPVHGLLLVPAFVPPSMPTNARVMPDKVVGVEGTAAYNPGSGVEGGEVATERGVLAVENMPTGVVAVLGVSGRGRATKPA